MFDKKSLFESSELGMALEIFYGSVEGAYLMRRAKQEILAGMYQLKDVDPTNVKEIMAAQNRIHVAESFQQWIEDGIADGVQAHQNIMSEELGQAD